MEKKKNTMDSYVVCIYRRDTKNPGLLVGVVEEVGVEGKRTFHNLGELWAILFSGKRPRGRGKEKGVGIERRMRVREVRQCRLFVKKTITVRLINT